MSAAYLERLRALGLEVAIREFPEGTHTAQDAADAIGCPVAAIVKSLVFTLDGEPILVLVSGANRVDTDALGARLGGALGKADARTVKQATGYSIGGVLYALKWPNPWPTTFGHHEFFHACTAVAAILHYIAMWFAVF